jgi:predicted RNA-binding Zn-ribbon protein involved in translation (DUF1610 family)
MMAGGPTGDEDASFGGELYVAALPERSCSACGDTIARRAHRVTLRASWRAGWEYLCPNCWDVIVRWAARFALQQRELPL